MAEKLLQSAGQHGEQIEDDDIDMALEYCDRELFAQFRDKKLTLAQFKSRVMLNAFGVNYKVLDDFRGEILDEFLKQSTEK